MENINLIFFTIFFFSCEFMEFIINFVGVTVNRFCLNLVEFKQFFFTADIYFSYFHICIININQSHTNCIFESCLNYFYYFLTHFFI